MAGTFLVGRHALINGDVDMAANTFTSALIREADNPRLLYLAFQSRYLNGNIETASVLAARFERRDEESVLSGEPAAAVTAREGDWQGVLLLSDHLKVDEARATTGTVFKIWALAALERDGAARAQLATLKARDNDDALSYLSQKAMLEEYFGNSAEAAREARKALGHDNISIGMTVTMAGVLLRSGYRGDALDILSRLNHRLNLNQIKTEITAGRSPLLRPPSLLEALAFGILTTYLYPHPSLPPEILLTRLHLAAYLDPDNDYIKMLLGENFLKAGWNDRGFEVLSAVSPSDIFYPSAQILVASVHRLNPDRRNNAVRTLVSLIKSDPNNPFLQFEHGLALRAQGHNMKALKAFNHAIALGFETHSVQYYRGITLSALGYNADAETAFRRAISLSPFDANTLNYLGYWMVERDLNLDEAKTFILQAVEQQPNNGAFIDSLGWVYFKKGQYNKAVELLERAAKLLAAEPVIADHLGDVYLKLGRNREAIYEWRRAIRFGASGNMLKNLTRKIDQASLP